MHLYSSDVRLSICLILGISTLGDLRFGGGRYKVLLALFLKEGIESWHISSVVPMVP